jgi:hypothetical protein
MKILKRLAKRWLMRSAADSKDGASTTRLSALGLFIFSIIAVFNDELGIDLDAESMVAIAGALAAIALNGIRDRQERTLPRIPVRRGDG